MKKARFLLTATLLGNTLEWFDFALYSYLVPVFMKIFFPSDSSWVSMTIAFIVLAVGYLVRPIGGLMYGYLGDRFGRKTGLLISIAAMTVPVFLIGLLPTYDQIGPLAPFLLTILRFFQGISAGGEFPGAITYLVESSPKGSRALFGSFAFIGVQLGVLLSAADFTFLLWKTSVEELAAWGWRLPFLLGGILGLITLYMREKLHESPFFKQSKSAKELLRHPIQETFLYYKKNLLQAFGITILDAVAYNMIIIYSTTDLVENVGFSMEEAILINSAAVLASLFCFPLSGKLADRFGARLIASLGCIPFILFSYPLLSLHLTHSFPLILSAHILLGIFLGMSLAPLPVLLCEIFPTQVRYSGIAIGYNLAVTLLGGTTPLIATYLIHWTHSITLPAILLTVGAALTLLTLKSIGTKTSLQGQ